MRVWAVEEDGAVVAMVVAGEVAVVVVSAVEVAVEDSLEPDVARAVAAPPTVSAVAVRSAANSLDRIAGS